MIIFQVLFSLGILGILSFIFYWFAVALNAGPKSTQDQINNNLGSLIKKDPPL